MIGSILGTVFSLGANLVAEHQAAEAENEAFRLSQQELLRSARLADANAMDAVRRGGLLAAQARRRGVQLQAAQRVGFGASGLEAGEGTPAALAARTAAAAELEAATIENDAVRTAFGMRETARQYRSRLEQLSAQKAAGDTARLTRLMSGTLGAGSRLLGGG